MIAPELAVVTAVDVSYDDVGDRVVAKLDPKPVFVLVAPGACSDLDASRPDGARVALTLHFPKSWCGAPLKGARVDLRGRRFRVVGDPVPYTAVNVPGCYNMPVEVEAVDG